MTTAAGVSAADNASSDAGARGDRQFRTRPFVWASLAAALVPGFGMGTALFAAVLVAARPAAADARRRAAGVAADGRGVRGPLARAGAERGGDGARRRDGAGGGAGRRAAGPRVAGAGGARRRVGAVGTASVVGAAGGGVRGAQLPALFAHAAGVAAHAALGIGHPGRRPDSGCRRPALSGHRRAGSGGGRRAGRGRAAVVYLRRRRAGPEGTTARPPP